MFNDHGCFICEALEFCHCEPETNRHGVYGAYTFFLLHKGDVSCPVRKLTAWEKLLDGHNLYGRAIGTGLMSEAARVYLALCKRFNIQPEAV